MKEFKLLKPGWAGRKAPQSELAEQTAPRPEAGMQTDAVPRKPGRLSREDQRRLGDILQRSTMTLSAKESRIASRICWASSTSGKDPS